LRAAAAPILPARRWFELRPNWRAISSRERPPRDLRPRRALPGARIFIVRSFGRVISIATPRTLDDARGLQTRRLSRDAFVATRSSRNSRARARREKISAQISAQGAKLSSRFCVQV
jgi:hypothetical protein